MLGFTIKKFMTTLAAALVAITTFATPARAHNTGDGAPNHLAATADCVTSSSTGRTVRLHHPRMDSSTRNFENVSWSADLYRYTTTYGWTRPYSIDTSMPWLYASAGLDGIANYYGAYWFYFDWWPNGQNAGLWYDFKYLPAGSYAVKQYMRWNDEGIYHAAEWTTFTNGFQICNLP